MPIRGSKKIRVDTRKYVETFLCIPCENYCTQTSQNCADTLRNFAPLREKKICSYVLLSNTKFCVILCIAFPSQVRTATFSSVCKFFAILCLSLPSMKKSKKVRFITRLAGIWISRKYVVYLCREKEILPQRGYLLHFCPIFLVKKGKITRHMRKNRCRII